MDEYNQEMTDAEVQSGDETTEESHADKVDREVLEDKKRHIKKLESRIAELESQTPPKKEEPKQAETSSLSRQEAILIARGLDETSLEKANKIAQVEGVTLLEAVEGDVFKAWKTAEEQRQKAEEAKLGASSKSGKSAKQKDVTTPGLSREEHKKLWNSRR